MAKEAAAATQPNLYELSGDGIKITYTLEPILGGPQFNYDDGKLSRLFKGGEIRTEDTEIGTLVSVTIHLEVDTGSTSFSVVLPKVGLGTSSSEPITTIGITTVHKRRIPGPTPQGQDDLYTVHPMKGTAKIVRS
ncbi:hypothetical protein [Bradyrhizobium sp.]